MTEVEKKIVEDNFDRMRDVINNTKLFIIYKEESYVSRVS